MRPRPHAAWSHVIVDASAHPAWKTHLDELAARIDAAMGLPHTPTMGERFGGGSFSPLVAPVGETFYPVLVHPTNPALFAYPIPPRLAAAWAQLQATHPATIGLLPAPVALPADWFPALPVP